MPDLRRRLKPVDEDNVFRAGANLEVLKADLGELCNWPV